MHTITLCTLSIVSTDLTCCTYMYRVKKYIQVGLTFKNVEIPNNTLCTFNEQGITEYSSCCSFWRFALHVLSNLCSLTETEPDILLHT